MNTKNTDKVCALAWFHLAANTSGRLRLCCTSLPGLGFIQNDTGPKHFHLHKAGHIEAAWNASSQRALRLDMLAGREPEPCGRCFQEEAVGMHSPRNSWNDYYRFGKKEAAELTDELGSAPVDVRYLDLRLGNLCNLKCRMCNPYSSRKWMEDWEEVEGTLPENDRRRITQFDWFETESFWQSLKPHLETIDQIYFTGGEPMLSKMHLRILAYLVERGLASKIHLKYNTNLTVIAKEAIESWALFKKVQVNGSIDGVGALNEYIRHPSDWREVHSNLLRLDGLACSLPQLELNLHVTVQILNILHLPEILDYTRSFSKICPLPYLNVLNDPAHLNIRTLPARLKELAITRIRRWQAENPISGFAPEHAPAWQRIQDLLGFLTARDMYPSEFGNFAAKTRLLDARRSERLAELNPELAEAVDGWPGRPEG